MIAFGEGFDTPSVTARPTKGLQQSQKQGEAESEALLLDYELKAVIDARAALPFAIKAGILALVRSIT